jgi:hypothetical protein
MNLTKCRIAQQPLRGSEIYNVFEIQREFPAVSMERETPGEFYYNFFFVIKKSIKFIFM